MKRLALTMVLLALAAGEASAAKRHDISNMSCEQIQGLLEKERTALLVFPAARVKGMNRWGLYAAERACRAPEVAVRKRLRSTTGTCFVYQCTDNGRAQER
jgi:hypothetical protein